MDNTLNYQSIIVDLFNEYAAFWQSTRGIQHQVIADKEQHHYQLLMFGWQDGKRYVHTLAFHIDIIDGKVWIQQNNTEALIADELVAAGVQKNDIILGFIAPDARQYTGFAVA